MTKASATFSLFTLAFLVGCAEAPVPYHKVKGQMAADLDVKSENAESPSKEPESASNKGDLSPSDDANPVEISDPKPDLKVEPKPDLKIDPKVDPKPDPVEMKTSEELAAEKAKEAEKIQKEKQLALEKLERVPMGCMEKGTVTDKDFVLFNGEDVKYTASTKSIALNDGWKMDGAWNDGRIGVEMKRGQPALTFDNETFYHGFDLTPASVNGIRKTFTIKGFDVYYDSTRNAGGKFGMRLIKPGENEGGGDFEKRSWFKTDPAGGGADALQQTLVVDSNCKLFRFYTPKIFIDQNKVANRFIWEMMPNWEKNDKLFIYKIVLKGFEWK